MQLTSVMPPNVYVQRQIGAQLDSLGAKLVNKGIAEVEARLAQDSDVEVANAAFNDTIAGVKVQWRNKDGNGVRGVATGYDIVDGIAKLAGVKSIGAFETMPLQVKVTADSDASTAALKLLLRPSAADRTSISVVTAGPE